MEPKTTPTEKIPKFTVFLLAILCLASLGTGGHYWYTNYFRPSQAVVPVIIAQTQVYSYDPPYVPLPPVVEAPTEPVFVRPVLEPRPQFVALWETPEKQNVVGHLFSPTYPDFETYVLQGETCETRPALHPDIHIHLDDDLNIVLQGWGESPLQAFVRAYIDYDFFLQNPMLTFNTQYAEYDWEIFAFYIAPDDFAFNQLVHMDSPLEAWGDLVEMFTIAALYNTRLDVTEFDQVLTITTPSSFSDDLHYVLQARLLRHITS